MSGKYINGEDKIIARLNTLSKSGAGKAIRKGTRAGSKIVAAQARQDAPVLQYTKKNREPGFLKANIKVKAMKRSRKWTGTTVVLDIFYGKFVDLGTRHAKAVAFLERAADQKRSAAQAVVMDVIKTEVEKTLD